MSICLPEKLIFTEEVLIAGLDEASTPCRGHLCQEMSLYRRLSLLTIALLPIIQALEA